MQSLELFMCDDLINFCGLEKMYQSIKVLEKLKRKAVNVLKYRSINS